MSEKPQYGKIFRKMAIPPKETSPKKKYDFTGMEVGDAILLPASAAGCATWVRQRFGWTLVRRTIDESSIMLWRTK